MLTKLDDALIQSEGKKEGVDQSEINFDQSIGFEPFPDIGRTFSRVSITDSVPFMATVSFIFL